MMKTYRLTPYFLLILALATLLVGAAAAQEGDTTPTTAPQAVTWTDNFESYETVPWPTFPNPPWTRAGYIEAGVYTSTHMSGVKSLQMIGIVGPGECGGSIAYRPVGGVAPMDIEVWVRTGDQDLAGCHQKYATIELSTGQDWAFAHRGLIAFTEDGQIRGGDWEIGETEYTFLGTYTKEVWYKVNIHYEVLNSSTVRLVFSIDGGVPITFDTPIKSHEPWLAYIGLWGAEGFAWYDDITVTSTEGAPPPLPGNLYLPSIIYR